MTGSSTTSALVAVLSSDSVAAGRAQRAITARAGFTVGQPEGRRLPLVLEGRDPAACREAHDWLARLDGVENVELVFVDFGGPAGEAGMGAAG